MSSSACTSRNGSGPPSFRDFTRADRKLWLAEPIGSGFLALLAWIGTAMLDGVTQGTPLQGKLVIGAVSLGLLAVLSVAAGACRMTWTVRRVLVGVFILLSPPVVLPALASWDAAADSLSGNLRRPVVHSVPGWTACWIDEQTRI